MTRDSLAILANHPKLKPPKLVVTINNPLAYCIAGRFGEFGESCIIRQTKTIQSITLITIGWSINSANLHLPNASICQTFPTPNFPIESYLFLPNNLAILHASSILPNILSVCFPTIWYYCHSNSGFTVVIIGINCASPFHNVTRCF